MLVKVLVAWFILAAAIAIVAALMPSVDVDGGVLTLLGVSMVFALVNALIGPVLHFISLPLTLITLGLFALVVNGVLFAITAGLTDSLDVGGFVSTVVAALLISAVTAVLWFAIDHILDRPRTAHQAQA
jgi:putative membrane protein